MNDMQKNILEQNIGELFGFEEMNEEEKAALLDDIGSTILESAILRFSVEGDAKEVAQLEDIVEKHGDDEDVFAKVLESIPTFETILTEEISAFKEEATNVLA